MCGREWVIFCATKVFISMTFPQSSKDGQLRSSSEVGARSNSVTSNLNPSFLNHSLGAEQS